MFPSGNHEHIVGQLPDCGTFQQRHYRVGHFVATATDMDGGECGGPNERDLSAKPSWTLLVS